MAFVNVGPLELLVIGIIALLVLGPQRLPEAARSVGRGVREMKEALSGNEDEREPRYADDYEDGEDDEPEPEGSAPAPTATQPPDRPALDS